MRKVGSSRTINKLEISRSSFRINDKGFSGVISLDWNPSLIA
jgi:hypothetical protein